MNINKLIIAGRLGKDPELKTTTNGTSVASFSVATNRTWTDKQGQKQEDTEWVNCVAWGKTAETISKFFHKGKEIYLEGRIQTRKWQDKEGNNRYTTEMVIDTFQFVGYDKDGGSKGNTPPPPQDNVSTDIDVEEIPF